MFELDRDKVMELAREAVARMGEDHISPLYRMVDGSVTDEIDVNRYGGSSVCRYVTPSGEAGCIVGQVLHAAGVPLEVLQKNEGGGAHIVITKGGVEEHIDVTSEALEALVGLQDAQDRAVPWGWLMGNYEDSVSGEALARLYVQDTEDSY